MEQLTATFAKHHRRLDEIVNVLGRYGFAAWAASRGTAIPGVKITQRLRGPGPFGTVSRERLRGAATDLGTTFVKFGQMLSLPSQISSVRMSPRNWSSSRPRWRRIRPMSLRGNRRHRVGSADR